MGETKTESGVQQDHSWAFARQGTGSAVKCPPAETMESRRPEFSQCFGDKAAPEELTEGEQHPVQE